MPERRKKTIRLWASVFIITIGVISINAIKSYQAFYDLMQNEERENVTKDILRTLKEVYSSVQNAELGLRGFLLSGDEMYLIPYFQSLNKINESLTELQHFHFSIPDQNDNIRELEALIVKRLQESSDHIDAKQDFPSVDYLSQQWMRESHQSMVAISEQVNQIEVLEYDLLDQQSTKAQYSQKKLSNTIIVANGLGILMLMLVAGLVAKELSRRQQDNNRLEKMVYDRTAELEHYSSELQRSNRELQEFAFVASHDLQEPLRKIRAFGDRVVALYEGKLGEGEDYIRRMQKAATRMSLLIEGLLAFSRVSTRKEPFAEVNINRIIENVLDDLEIKIQESKARIIVEEMPILTGDGMQMHQLFQNLITNAIKFVPQGKKPDITVTCEESASTDPYYEISVVDNGIGIEKQYLEKIFTPFQRLHGRSTYEGSGIGLAVCRRIVERHHGQLRVTSEIGSGSVFTVIVPKTIKDLLPNADELAQLNER